MEDKDTALVAMLLICCVLAVFHTLYNNLLINLRFRCKVKCHTTGICLYDVLNFIWCHCILLKPCRDRCFTRWTFGKWAVFAIIYGVTIHLVQDHRERWLGSFQVGEPIFDDGKTDLDLDVVLIVWVLQHPIFMVSRLPIFLLYALATCCCDKGMEHPDGDDAFKDRVIHFDYIEYELGMLNNFENHLVGREELQYVRRLSVIRQASIRQRQ